MKVNILIANFSTLAGAHYWAPDLGQQNRLLQNYYSRQLTPKLSAERKTLLNK